MQSANQTVSNPNAPGCYAAPSVFGQDSTICQQCPAYRSCGDACIETLKALRDKINIEDILARHRQARASTIEKADPPPAKLDFSKFMPSMRKPPEEKIERKAPRAPDCAEVTAEQEAIIKSISQKNARELATKWITKGLLNHICAELAARRNPFAEQKVNYEFVACEMLIAGVVTRAELKKAFMKRLGAKRPWDDATASSHVGIVMPAMIAFGIAIETDEGFVLSPRLVGHNV